MEEKERYYYEKILRDCVIPEGLFEIKDREGNFYLIIENKKDVDTITNLLNQQDKENKQLKQQLHDLPKKIVEEIRDDMSKRIMGKQIKWGDNIQIGFICNAINECLDAILKKYGDNNESIISV